MSVCLQNRRHAELSAEKNTIPGMCMPGMVSAVEGRKSPVRCMTSKLSRWMASLDHTESALRSESEPVCLALQKLVQVQAQARFAHGP